MERSARHSPDVARIVVVAACAASAGAHLGLVPSHLEHERALGAAFVAAAVLALVVVGAMTIRPSRAAPARLAVALLASLIAAYALAVTVGIPSLAGGPEPVDAIGLATKSVEAVGLVFALHLIPTLGGHRPLSDQEARP
jgi:hypothetical protein